MAGGDLESPPHRASNGPTERLNFCAKQVERTGRGFTKFAHYRLRVLLYAGGVRWPKPIQASRITSWRPR
jgi:hypothetical protein